VKTLRFRSALTQVCAAALLALSAAVSAAGIELGDAPVRHESQDARDWVPRLVPRAAPSRAQVASLYNDVYVPGSAAALVWTGSVAGCLPGTTNLEHQQAVVARINYFRALVDLPAVQLLTGIQTTQVQASALMMSANNALSHQPPMSWLCFSGDGATGAANANLALGVRGVDAIDGFMDDFGAGNTAVGHRRWLLHPPRASMATGDTTGGIMPPRPANAVYVFGPQNARPATPNGVAWPPAGFIPYQNLPYRSNRWSFSFPGANFAGATVTMSGPAGAIPVTIEPLATGFGDNTIVFLPSSFDYAKPAADTTYTVQVSGMTGAGVPATIQYTVTVIDPASPGPSAVPVTVVEFYNQALDHYFITWVAAEIALLDGGTTIKGWTRTGKTFKAYSTSQPGTTDICRIYIIPLRGDSHFFGRGTDECNNTMAAHPDFILEEPKFMAMFLPVAGVCPAGTIAVYRVFSGRADANHRYMIEAAVRATMAALGWIVEGDGPDFVVMCAPA
jgi:uncharacterized protein YkwD